MIFRDTDLAGLVVVELQPLSDERGSFARTFDAAEWEVHEMHSRVVQANLSRNVRRGTLRGMHYQESPHMETKLVRCSRGSIFDVAIDIRRGSPTVCGWFGLELSEENGRMLHIPEGFAHGFLTLTELSEVKYLMSRAYAPEAARGVRWDDPAFGIDWPSPPLVVSGAGSWVSGLRIVKRVLVSGATGFVGRHALAPLLERGFDVHAVARTRPVGDAAPDVSWHEIDLLDARATDALVADLGATHLLHLAWYAEHGKFWDAHVNLDWIAASLRLLRSFHASGGRRVVVAGTCAEYDWTGDCCDERTALRPATLYGVSKNALRQVLESYASSSGLSAAWGRIFFMYGPGEPPSRVVAAVARALVSGKSIPCSLGTQVRDFLYVADVAAAFAALVDSTLTGSLDIGSGRPIALRDLLLRLEQLAGRHDLVLLGEAPQRDEPGRIVADIRRLREELAWQPAYALDEALEQTLSWWRRMLTVGPETENCAEATSSLRR